MNTRLLIIGVAPIMFLTACETTRTTGGPAETNDFLRNALDTYGVIDVVPSAPVPNGRQGSTMQRQPLDATTQTPRPTITVAEACAGKTGIQPGLRDTRTNEWLDCGPSNTAHSS